MGGRTVERMNAQIRYGLASLLAAALLLVVAKAMTDDNGVETGGGELFMALGVIGFLAGLVLLIVGLVRRPRSVQTRQD